MFRFEPMMMRDGDDILGGGEVPVPPSTPMPLIGFLNDITLGLDMDDDQLCEVCLEDLPISEFPGLSPTAACQHPVKVCSTCLQRAIELQVRDKGCDQVRCPSCSERLRAADITEIADRPTAAE